MAIITLPSSLRFGPGSGLTQRAYGTSNEAPLTGSGQWVATGQPRWILTLAAPKILTPLEAGAWRALLLRLRGRANHLEAWDPANPAPQGTARGSMTLSAAAALGAEQISIGGTAGTVRAGDMLRIGALGLGSYQLVAAAADATLAGVVAIEPPLRRAFASGTAVAWDKPTALFKAIDDMPEMLSANPAGHVQGLKFQLLEQWT